MANDFPSTKRPKVLFITNLPSPYRVAFFNELAKYVDLTVVYDRESSSERDIRWTAEASSDYRQVFLNGIRVGVDKGFSLKILSFLSKKKYDYIINAEAVSPSGVLAIGYCKLRHIPYFIEIDGGFHKDGKGFREHIKKFLYTGAIGYFSTSREADEYLRFYGADSARIHRYPFTSIAEKDLAVSPPTGNEKTFHRNQLGMTERHIVLSIGRFSYKAGYGKGYDILLDVASKSDRNVGFYIVGDEPTDEFIRAKEERELNNIHFVGFKTKDELSSYYRAADIFVLLSRGEAWGLVVNEAMANALPVIASNKVIAALELVRDGVNGFVVPSEDPDTAKTRIDEILFNLELMESMRQQALKTALDYTIEASSRAHLQVLRGGSSI